jgi:NAD(P)-dependent dehydrogenase (short-subunit alcohol dehydrogenase family)
MSKKEFEGKTALVTGGSRGIGRASCLALAREGARVAVNYVSNEKAAREVVAEIERLGGEAMTVEADVSDPDSVAKSMAPICR